MTLTALASHKLGTTIESTIIKPKHILKIISNDVKRAGHDSSSEKKNVALGFPKTGENMLMKYSETGIKKTNGSFCFKNFPPLF